ncbi:copper resistance protein CopQ [Cupriavidus sp. 2TAF22]|uniref:copper resistance protein CopQ n=1 Tax=unclassified Cupriavidus TaxID=2640874 RepID=UPI003F921C08
MNKHLIFKDLLIAGSLVAACLSGAAQATGPRESTHPGDRYGYNLHRPASDAFTDRMHDGKAAPAADPARIVAGQDQSGVSAAPARTMSPAAEGAAGHPGTRGAEGGRLLAGRDLAWPSSQPEHARVRPAGA